MDIHCIVIKRNNNSKQTKMETTNSYRKNCKKFKWDEIVQELLIILLNKILMAIIIKGIKMKIINNNITMKIYQLDL